jgi:hypothetical protein
MGKNERVRECESVWRGDYVCIRMRERESNRAAKIFFENFEMCFSSGNRQGLLYMLRLLLVVVRCLKAEGLPRRPQRHEKNMCEALTKLKNTLYVIQNVYIMRVFQICQYR